jgi:hypothetical protein
MYKSKHCLATRWGYQVLAISTATILDRNSLSVTFNDRKSCVELSTAIISNPPALDTIIP